MKKRLIVALLTAVSIVQSSTASASSIENVIVPHSISIVDGILDSECPEDLSFSFGESEVIVPVTICEQGGLLVGVRKRCNNPYAPTLGELTKLLSDNFTFFDKSIFR